MKKFELPKTPLVAGIVRLRHNTGDKPIGIMVSLVILLMFGDTLLPLLGHLLHVLHEVIDLTLEHFLEFVFGASKRQSQIIIFYFEIALVIGLIWHVSRKAYCNSRRACANIQENWQVKTGKGKAKACIKAALMISMLGTTFFLFS